MQPTCVKQLAPAAAPSLLNALGRSVAWALGCAAGWVLAYQWAAGYRAFEVGAQGYEQFAGLLAVVLLGVVLLHTQAHKKFAQVYLARGASQQPNYQLTIGWMLVLSLLRTIWLLAVPILALGLAMKSSVPDAGWR